MRARFAAGFFAAAARTAHALIRLDDAHGEAHVTLARVHLAEGAHAEARQALDAAAANDFSVRETTAYAVVSDPDGAPRITHVAPRIAGATITIGLGRSSVGSGLGLARPAGPGVFAASAACRDRHRDPCWKITYIDNSRSVLWGGAGVKPPGHVRSGWGGRGGSGGLAPQYRRRNF